MMYNAARALALIGLVGVCTASNTTSNTTSVPTTGGSSTQPAGGDCADWTGLEASSVVQLASRRQLQGNTTSTGSSGCTNDDVPKCLYASVEFTGMESSVVVNGTGQAGCPNSYVTADGDTLKEVLSSGLCGGDVACVAKTKAVLKLKLRCKSTGAWAVVDSSRRRLNTAVTLEVKGSVHLPDVITGSNSLTAVKVGGILKALEGVTKTTLATALKAALNGKTAPTTQSVLANVNAVTPVVTSAKVALTDATNCSTLSAIAAWYAANCQGNTNTANAAKNMCVHFIAGPNTGTGSNAISFVVSSVVMAAAVLI